MADPLTLSRRWRAMPVAGLLRTSGRLFILLAVPLAITTPRIAVGAVHVTVSDVLGFIGGICWLLTTVRRPFPRTSRAGATWPFLVLLAGTLSLTASVDPRATAFGVTELAALWLLPAMAVPSLFESPRAMDQILVAVSVGSVVAAASNVWTAAEMGFADGIPQIWGPADYYQGYFQVLGVMVAVPRLATAISERRPGAGGLWAGAAVLNAVALLIAQTRGAWLAAAAAMLTLVLLQRGLLVASLTALLGVGAVLVLTADVAEVVRERVLSIFSLEGRLTGFDSSIIRLALVVSAWRMFLSHPIVGVRLKNFPTVLPDYAPLGLPDAVEMGPNHLLTPIQGPHSTYLSLLAEAGVLGAIAIVGWQVTAARRVYHQYREGDQSPTSRNLALTLVASVVVVAIYNCFSEMNATGALPLVCVLSLAYRVPPRGHA